MKTIINKDCIWNNANTLTLFSIECIEKYIDDKESKGGATEGEVFSMRLIWLRKPLIPWLGGFNIKEYLKSRFKFNNRINELLLVASEFKEAIINAESVILLVYVRILFIVSLDSKMKDS